MVTGTHPRSPVAAPAHAGAVTPARNLATSRPAPARAEPLLSVRGIEVVYDEVILVLRGLSLAVPQGSVVALLGANGAGKSTTLKAISGLLKSENGAVTRGEIVFDGLRVDGTDPDQIVRRGVFQVLEGRRIVADMTVLENLRLGAFTRRDRENVARDLEMVLGYFPRLRERSGLAGYLSGGEQQMLAIGRALMSAPRLLLVDELSLGLMPRMVDLCLDALRKLNREEGLTIVLVEQNTERALDVAQQVCVLASGRSVFIGAAESARRDVDLLHSYTSAAA